MRNLTCFPLPEGSYWKSSPYGWRTHPITGKRTLHRGTDYAAPAGTDVYAPFSGVASIGYEAGGAGHWVNVTAGSDVFKSFHHQAPGVVGWVEAGQVIAHIGNSGGSTGPHAHFELWDHGQNIDPTPYLDAAPFKAAAPAPMTPTEDEDVTVLARDSKTLAAYACNGLFKRYIATQDEFNAYKYIGAKDLGINDGFLALLTEIPRTKIDGV